MKKPSISSEGEVIQKRSYDFLLADKEKWVEGIIKYIWKASVTIQANV